MRYAVVSTELVSGRMVGRVLPPAYKVVATLHDMAVVICGTNPPTLEELIARLAGEGISAREIDAATAAILTREL